MQVSVSLFTDKTAIGEMRRECVEPEGALTVSKEAKIHDFWRLRLPFSREAFVVLGLNPMTRLESLVISSTVGEGSVPGRGVICSPAGC